MHIRTTPSITIKDYTKGQKLDVESPQPSTVELNIDKAHYWAFNDDDVDRHQSDYEYIENWTRDASEQMRTHVDQKVLDDVHPDADSANQGTGAGVQSGDIDLGATGGNSVPLDRTNILDKIVDAGTVLDEQNVPESDRWFVMPPWACGLIKQSDLQDASLAGDGTSLLRNGRIGMIDRFTIYRSNQLSTETDNGDTVWNMMFGHRSALTFASQLTKVEGPIRAQDTFGNIYRGLQVYGYKTVKPEAQGLLYARKG